jgi:hypothetical protein
MYICPNERFYQWRLLRGEWFVILAGTELLE